MAKSKWYQAETVAKANQAIDNLNALEWFPAKDGITQRWAEPNSARETLTGKGAFPGIPDARLDYEEVPQEDRVSFIIDNELEIVELDPNSDLVQLPEEEI